MTPASAMEDDLRSDIQPACPHDNSPMVYQAPYKMKTDPFRPTAVEGFPRSYGCVEPGCAARFRHTEGYFTLDDSPESPVPIAAYNMARCPTHHYFLYKRVRSGSEKDLAWCCAVRGCEHVTLDGDIPGSWVR
jgi:hypothetical protein